MDVLDVVLLVVGGLFAGCVNTIAGGGSLLTVPLLVLIGVPGDVANGTNRVGILTSNVSAAEAFRRQGVSGLSRVVPVLVPVPPCPFRCRGRGLTRPCRVPVTPRLACP